MSPVLGRPLLAPRSRPVKPGETATQRRRENLPEHRELPNRTRRGAPTRAQEARQRGAPPAATTAQDRVLRNNGRRVPQTRTARATHAQPRHARWCQATLNQVRGARQDRPPPPKEPEERRGIREVETRKRPRSSCKAETRPRSAQETLSPRQDDPGWTKQQEPPPPVLDHPGTKGGQAPSKGATG